MGRVGLRTSGQGFSESASLTREEPSRREASQDGLVNGDNDIEPAKALRADGQRN
jgi:hypothetical protein